MHQPHSDLTPEKMSRAVVEQAQSAAHWRMEATSYKAFFEWAKMLAIELAKKYEPDHHGVHCLLEAAFEEGR